MISINKIPSLFENPEWADVAERIKKDPEKYDFEKIDNLAIPVKFPERFVEIMKFFRIAFKDGEISERVFKITELVVKLNPTNFTAWKVRRECIFKLKKDLEKENEMVKKMIEKSLKNYQMWFHKRQIISAIENKEIINADFEFIESVLRIDNKNYHAWTYRSWFIRNFKIWSNEDDFTKLMIEFDVRNNSAWNHRFYYLKDRLEGFNFDDVKKEIEYCFKWLTEAPDNESTWNYLFGLVNDHKKEIFSDNEMQNICQKVEKLVKNDEGFYNRHALSFLVDVLPLKEKNEANFSKCAEFCTLLENEADIIRKSYWRYRKSEFKTIE